MTKLRAFTPEGIERVREMLVALQQGGQNDPRLLLENDRFTVPVDDIDVKPRPFADRQEAGEHLVALLSGVRPRPGHSVESDAGLWTWLSVLWLDQLAPRAADGTRRPGKPYRFVLADRDYRTYYRHLLNGPYRIVRAHSDRLRDVRVLLATPVDKPGDLVEQIASHQRIVTSPTLLALATSLYIDPVSAQPKKGAAGRDRPGVLRRLIDVLTQFDATFDTWSMSTADLLDMLPDEFDRFRTAQPHSEVAGDHPTQATGATRSPNGRPPATRFSTLSDTEAPTPKGSTSATAGSTTDSADPEDVDFSVTDDEAGIRLSSLFTSSADRLDDREINILALRMIVPEARRRMSLDDLGARFSVTRERIRQIETALIKRGVPAALLSQRGCEMVGHLQQAVTAVASAEQIYQSQPALRSAWLVPSEGSQPTPEDLDACLSKTALAVIVAAADGLDWDGTWVWRGRVDDIIARTTAIIEEATDARGAGDASAIEQRISVELGIDDAQTIRDWIAHTGAELIAGRWFASRLRSIPDRVAAVLEDLDEPATGDDLHRLAAPGRERRSFRNALVADDRIARVSKDMWALAGWGFSPYSGIRSSMEAVLREQPNSRMPLHDLAERLVQAHPDIAESSIRAYAEWPPFQVKYGTVMLWDGSLPNSWTDMSLTADVQIDHDDISLLMHLTGEHLRGSGSAIPPQLALRLGVHPNQSVRPNNAAPTISWKGAQPTIGSIRQTVERLGLHEGDQVKITWKHRDPEQFEIDAR